MNIVQKYNAEELTPVEEYNGVYFKRDDKFIPSDTEPAKNICGGKIRQAIYLLHNNADIIKNEYNNTIGTVSSLKSPQGIIMSKLSTDLGFKVVMGLGYQKDFEKCCENFPFVRISKELGADVRILTKAVYMNVIESKMEKAFGPHFRVAFGINLKNDFDAILGSVANQVQNIPKDLDTLVVPCGSAVTLTGILIGLDKFNINPKRIVGIQISGFDRQKSIWDAIPFEYKDCIPKFEFYVDKTYPYSKGLNKYIDGTDIELSPIYESKAYEYAQKHLNLLTGKTKDLFWIVGNESTIC